MHEYAHLHGMLDKLEDGVHDLYSLLGGFSELDLAPFGVDDVGQHRCGEVQAKHMNLSLERTLD